MTAQNSLGAGPDMSPGVVNHCTWCRPVLGVFWSEALGRRYAFTTDTAARLYLWDLLGCPGSMEARLLAEGISPTGSRLLSVGASRSCGLIVCGDQAGNVCSFAMPNALFEAMNDGKCLSYMYAITCTLQLILLSCPNCCVANRPLAVP